MCQNKETYISKYVNSIIQTKQVYSDTLRALHKIELQKVRKNVKYMAKNQQRHYLKKLPM